MANSSSSSKRPTHKTTLAAWLGIRFVLVAALPLLAVALLAWQGLMPQLREDVGIRHQALARVIAGEISTYLAGARRGLESFSLHLDGSPALRDAQLDRQMDSLVGNGDMFDAIYMANANAVITHIGLPEDRRSVRGDLLGLDLSRRDVVKRAFARNADLWSAPFLSTVTGRLVVALAIPLGDGLLIGEVPIDRLSDFLAGLPTSSGQVTQILDRQGGIVADSRRQRAGEHVSQATLALVRQAITDGTSTWDFSMEGKDFIGSAVRIAPLDWSVLVAEPTQQALMPLTTTLGFVAASAGGALLLAIAVALWLARRIAVRFSIHTNQARAIAGGDYGHQSPASDILELAELSTDLLHMSQAIRNREQALSRSETRFRSVVSNAPVLMFEFDRSGRFQLIEGRVLEVLGLSPGQLVGTSVLEFMRATPQAEDHVRQALAGKPQHFAARFGDLYFETYLSPARGSDDLPASVIGVAVDVTASKLAEQRLQETSLELERFFNSSIELLCIADTKGHFRRLNSEWHQVLGYETDELLDKPFLYFVHPDDVSATVQAMGELDSYKQLGGFTNRYRCKDGSYRCLEWRSFQFGDNIYGTARDITERLRAEAGLRESEQRFRSVVQNAYAIIFILDSQGTFLLSEGRGLARLGLEPGKVVGQSAQVLYADHPSVLEGIRRAQNGEFVQLVNDLGDSVFETVYSPHLDADGKVQGVVGIAIDITERRRAEDALRLTQFVVDNAPDAIYWVDEQARITYVNHAGLEALGYTRDEMRDLTVFDLDPDFPRARWQTHWANTQEKGRYTLETAHRTKDGRVFPVEISISVIRQGDKTIHCAFTRDISERKRAQGEITRAYGQSRIITQAVHDALYMTDLEGRLLWWNKHLENMTGMEPTSLAGRHYLDLMDPSEVSKASASFQAVKVGGFADLEALTRTVAGSVPYHYHSVLVRDDQGRPVGIAGVGRDISEQVRSREKLRLSATVLESTREGIMVTDTNSVIIAVNQAFTDITGYSEADALGKTPRILSSDRQNAAFYQAMWQSIAETGHWQGELWNRHRDGRTFPEWLTISAVRNTEGKIVNYVGVFTDISQIKQSEAQLEHLAHYDPLTDLPNRLLLTSRLNHAIHNAERSGSKLAVLFLDMDHFKNVNDSLGHPVGDELLRVFAQRVQQRIREGDTLARLGGDEFVVVLEIMKRPDDAAAVAHSIIEMMKEPFVLMDQHEIYIGTSIGISLYPDNGRDATELIRNADTAMYLAKSQGRNTYRYYTEALTTAANERLKMESRLRRALERDEFVLHYQPQISMLDGRIVGVEALMRWHDPENGLVPPMRFIPLAEETGLIQPMGIWALRTACDQLRQWLDEGMAPITMAVNLSPRQFAQTDLVAQVRAALERSRLPAEYLELEITESAIMESGERARATLRELKQLGITLSIDDFGTGYSSLAYLKQLPIDKLKIDKSFVDGIPDDRSDTAITSTIIAMAKNLNLRVLAEGVETEAQRLFLVGPGCDAFQGYLFSAPVTAEKLARLCQESFSIVRDSASSASSG